MQHWLLKSEPETWSFQQQRQEKTTHWDGVRNFQAQKYMTQMSIDDLAFFYHSGKQKSIVGVVKIIKLAYPDFTDDTRRFNMVDVEYVCDTDPVTLKQIKADPIFDELLLVKQSRLSVMPVAPQHWKKLCSMGQINELPSI